jgi:hypothetical protein
MTTTAAQDPEGNGDVKELGADIRELRQGMVKELKKNGRSTAPVAVGLQPR